MIRTISHDGKDQYTDNNTVSGADAVHYSGRAAQRRLKMNSGERC